MVHITVKLFGLNIIGIILAWLSLHPLDQWQAVFWNYLGDNAPIMWIGQSAWLILAALILTFFELIIIKVVIE